MLNDLSMVDNRPKTRELVRLGKFFLIFFHCSSRLRAKVSCFDFLKSEMIFEMDFGVTAGMFSQFSSPKEFKVKKSKINVNLSI